MMTETRCTKALAYIRTSNATNVGGNSPERQRVAIRTYAERVGIELVGEFCDAAMSGADPVDQRPGFADMLAQIEGKGVRTILVENNYSGQFARYLRSETSFVPDGHIRKYDGEPFMPHHIVDAVKEQMAGGTTLSVPSHEIQV